jgi:hypothetical protein
MADCFNELTIRGPSHILDIIQESKLLFSFFYPCPAEHQDSTWCLDHWGTPAENKKNPDPDAYSVMDSSIDTIIRSRTINTLSLRIWTALSPPNKFLEYLIQAYAKDNLWIKNLWSVGDKEGVWVGVMEQGSVSVKSLNW